MNGPVEIVTVRVGGSEFSAFERVQWSAAMNEAARSFRLEIAAEPGAGATHRQFEVFAPVEIMAGGELILRGHIDRRQPSISSSEASIAIAGRSKGADAVDSSAPVDKGAFKNKTPLDIAKDLDGGRAGFVSDERMEKIELYHVTPGETVFRAVERMARQQGLTLQGEPDGTIRLARATNPKRHAGGLVEGVNIMRGSADHNGSNRHSKVTVLGQRPSGHGPDSLEIEAIARDAGVPRDRPLIIVQRDDTTKAAAGQAARNRSARAAGEGLSASITVVGWRDEAGAIWTPGRLIWTESPFLDLAQDMLIKSVSCSQDRGGTLTELSLVDPRAFGGKKGKAAKSGKAWSTPSSAPPDNRLGLLTGSSSAGVA
jgi:prophage tail gpP-like protein